MRVIHDCEQGSEAWLRARMGLPTASEFQCLVAKGEGKGRATYMRKLAAEIVTNELTESYQSAEMLRGKLMEDEARQRYMFETEEDVEQVGFITNGRKGASPDSMVGKNGGLEIKTKRADILIDVLAKGELPNEHRGQCQGVIWVAELEWLDFVAYWPKMPQFRIRVYRDEAYIATLSDAVTQFNEELDAMVDRIRSYGKAA